MPTETKPKRASKKAAATPVVITSIKGFNTDMTCRGHKFEPGQTYTVKGKAVSCKSGFHACPDDLHPLSVFGFYAPGTSRYFEVSQSGDICRKETDKAASTILTVNIEICIGDLVMCAWDYVWSRAIKSDDAHVKIDHGAASATGDRGAASATGDQGAASATGYQGAAMSSGYEGRVHGAAGNAMFAVERDGNYSIVSVASGIAGQDGIKADTWYLCRAGKLVASS